MRDLFARCASLIVTIALLGASSATIVQPSANGAAWTPDAIAKLDTDLDTMLSTDPALRGAHYGVDAIDTATGAQLYAHGPDDEVQPASTLKLVVGSAALDKLGPQKTFHTELLRTFAGPSMSARPMSDFDSIVLRAGGDPFLSDRDIVNAVRSVVPSAKSPLRGIFIDDSRFEAAPYPTGWTWDDFAQSYAPHVSAMVLDENVASVIVTPGMAVGSRAKMASKDGPLTMIPIEGCASYGSTEFEMRATTGAAGSDDTIDVRISPRGCLQVFGSIPIGAPAESVDAAVVDPIVFAHDAIVKELRHRGIASDFLSSTAGVDAATRGSNWQNAPLDIAWSHDSEPLSTWLGPRFWIPSDNLVGEMLLRELGFVSAGAPGTTDNGIAYEKTWLQSIGVDLATVTLADGCGMSQYDRITARDLVKILQHDWNGPNRQLVLDSLPVGGARGTIEGIAGSDVAGRVFAKTGSMMHVRGLAGYLAPLHHGAVTFAFEVDDWNGAYPDLAALRARFLSRIVDDSAT